MHLPPIAQYKAWTGPTRSTAKAGPLQRSPHIVQLSSRPRRQRAPPLTSPVTQRYPRVRTRPPPCHQCCRCANHRPRTRRQRSPHFRPTERDARRREGGVSTARAASLAGRVCADATKGYAPWFARTLAPSLARPGVPRRVRGSRRVRSGEPAHSRDHRRQENNDNGRSDVEEEEYGKTHETGSALRMSLLPSAHHAQCSWAEEIATPRRAAVCLHR